MASIMPQSGQLDRRVTIKRFVVVKNEAHGRSTSTEYVADVWAKWQDLRGREVFAQGQLAEVSEARCIIRYRADVTADHLIFYRGKEYGVVGSPIELGRRQFIELMLTSGPRDRSANEPV